MDELNQIDIEGMSLALSNQELMQLTKPNGCQLQLVNNRVLNLDEDDDCDDSDEDPIVGGIGMKKSNIYDDIDLDSLQRTKEEIMKREYVSLVLNANNDPIKPGKLFRADDMFQTREDLSKVYSFNLGCMDEKYIGIHRMYENLGKFDDYLKTRSFTELVPNLVYKLTRIPGLGEHAKVNEDSLVMYNCALWTEGAKDPFDSTWLRRTTAMAHLKTDSILPGIRDLLLSSQQREMLEAFIRPEAAFGILGAKPRIPPDATIFCLLEVVRVVSQDKVAKLMRYTSVDDGQLPENTDSAKSRGLIFKDFFEASDEARRRGNYFFEHSQYKVAIQRYKSAIRLLEGFEYKDKQEESQAKDLLVKLYNNCARAHNVMGNPRRALAACKQASLVDDRVPKTYWHRMSAWAKKGHTERALGVARRAIQLFPDPSVRKPFIRAVEQYESRLKYERLQVDKLHKLMGRAIASS